ncbi:MAG: hypothetical protein MJZ57_02565 [Bacteroidales bacterium]|nr:hypothetical protein [Bacteroidales bacterium]
MKRTLLCIIGVLFLVCSVQAQRAHSQQEHKFVYMTSFGYASGLSKIDLSDQNGGILKTVYNKNPNFQINQLLAYQFNNYFYMGIGAGLDFWKYTAFVPVYLNFSVNMIDKKISPMAYVNLGYGFKWYLQSKPETMDRVVHGTSAGPMGEGGLGIRLKFNSKVSLVIAGCYKAQYSDIRYTVPKPGEQDFSAYSTNAVQKILYHFAGVRVGILY